MAEENEAEKKQSSGGRMKTILLVVVALLLVGGVAAGGMWYFMKSRASSAPAAKVAEKKAAKKKHPKPHYMAVKPSLVVNFEGNQELHYLQIGIDIMSYDEKALDDVKAAMPPLRNDLILLLTGQDMKTLISRQGRVKLRGEVLDTVRKVVAKEHPKAAKKIKAIYFTNFVMQ